MSEVNKNIDKKIHISDVISNILNELQIEIDIAKKHEEQCSSQGYFDGVISNQASIRGLESAIKIVKKYKDAFN